MNYNGFFMLLGVDETRIMSYNPHGYWISRLIEIKVPPEIPPCKSGRHSVATQRITVHHSRQHIFRAVAAIQRNYLAAGSFFSL